MVNEAKVYLSSHSEKCIHNPVVVEERQHRRELEAADVIRHVAAKETEAAAERSMRDKSKLRPMSEGSFGTRGRQGRLKKPRP